MLSCPQQQPQQLQVYSGVAANVVGLSCCACCLLPGLAVLIGVCPHAGGQLVTLFSAPDYPQFMAEGEERYRKQGRRAAPAATRLCHTRCGII